MSIHLKFEEEDFNAFEEVKWSSNRFNLERMRISEKLLLIGEELNKFLNPNPIFIEYQTTPWNPCIFNHHRVDEILLFFKRSKEEEKSVIHLIDKKVSIPEEIKEVSPHKKHIILGVRIFKLGIEAGLYLHSYSWIDLINFEHRTKNFWEMGKFLDIINSLPADFILLTANEKKLLGAEKLKEKDIEALQKEILEKSSFFFIGKFYPREDKILRGERILKEFKDIFLKLIIIFNFIAWSRNNDFISIHKEVKKEKVAIQAGIKDIYKDDKIIILNGVFKGKGGRVVEVFDKGYLKIQIGNFFLKIAGKDVRKI